MSAQYTLNAFGKKPKVMKLAAIIQKWDSVYFPGFSIYLIIGYGCHSENFEILKTTHTYPTK